MVLYFLILCFRFLLHQHYVKKLRNGLQTNLQGYAEGTFSKNKGYLYNYDIENIVLIVLKTSWNLKT